MRRIVPLSLSMLLMSPAAFAGSDTFLQAVGFALTGTDSAEVKVVDRKNCVFRVKSDIFYLNNLHVDRLNIQNWKRKDLIGREEFFTTVELHGDETVFTRIEDTEAFDATSLYAEMKKIPEPARYNSKEHTLTITTNEGARVGRAWSYLYSNGCIGKKSAF